MRRFPREPRILGQAERIAVMHRLRPVMANLQTRRPRWRATQFHITAGQGQRRIPGDRDALDHMLA